MAASRRTDPETAPTGFERLRRRAEYKAAARGARSGTPAFGLQSLARDDPGPARFGITITKKTAPRAVDRNRMRRRVREALRRGAALAGTPGHDYVIVGRSPLLTIAFDDLRDALSAAVAGRGRRRAKTAADPQGQ